MHAILVTMGTDGDVFPYVGLGARLRGRGHRVTLAGPETYQGLAAQHGLSFRCLVSQAAADEFLASPHLWHPIKSGLHGARWGVRFLREQYELLTELARDADALLVTNPGILAARLVQDRHAKPVLRPAQSCDCRLRSQCARGTSAASFRVCVHYTPAEGDNRLTLVPKLLFGNARLRNSVSWPHAQSVTTSTSPCRPA